MLDINSLAVDPTLSEEGTWIEYLGARFKIARANNRKAKALRSRLVLDNWDLLQADGEAADTKAREIDTKVIAHAVLLDWDGVADGEKPLKYTPELGEKYLSDPRFSDLYSFIEIASNNRANFREKAEKEVAESVKDSAAS